MIPGQSPVGDEGGAGDEEGGGGGAGSWTPGDAEGQWEWASFWNVKYCVYTGFNKTGCILTFIIYLEQGAVHQGMRRVSGSGRLSHTTTLFLLVLIKLAAS